MELDRPVLLTEKMFYTIAEVADATGIKTHVLRYWESQFNSLSPDKSKGNRRLYRRQDVDTILLIKDLLYRQKFSIEGARKHLSKLRREGGLKLALEPKVVLKADGLEKLKLAKLALVELRERLKLD